MQAARSATRSRPGGIAATRMTGLPKTLGEEFSAYLIVSVMALGLDVRSSIFSRACSRWDKPHSAESLYLACGLVLHYRSRYRACSRIRRYAHRRRLEFMVYVVTGITASRRAISSARERPGGRRTARRRRRRRRRRVRTHVCRAALDSFRATRRPECRRRHEEPVLIIGAGPAGLTAALELLAPLGRVHTGGRRDARSGGRPRAHGAPPRQPDRHRRPSVLFEGRTG